MQETDPSRRRFLTALATAGAGALAGCAVGGTERQPAAGTDGPTESPPATPLGTTAQNGQVAADATYTDLYRETIDSVAAVRVDTVGGSSQGTAWVFDGPYLVTNEHVVAGGGRVGVRFADEGWRRASVVGTDVYSDLAVLEVPDKPAEATALPMVPSPVPVGTPVAAIGNPFGLSGSMSAGIISGRQRTLPAPNGFSIPDAVQTDAALNPGNSGGPLVTLDGAVAGVVNAGGGDNIGFAISAALAKRVLPALIRTGEYDHSFMGIGIQPVTPRLIQANSLQVRRGVYVDRALDGGPADGLLQGSTGSTTVGGQTVPTGGDVIVRLDDTPIADRQDLSRFLALETSPGDTIEVGIARDGRRTLVNLTLGERPAP